MRKILLTGIVATAVVAGAIAPAKASVVYDFTWTESEAFYGASIPTLMGTMTVDAGVITELIGSSTLGPITLAPPGTFDNDNEFPIDNAGLGYFQDGLTWNLYDYESSYYLYEMSDTYYSVGNFTATPVPEPMSLVLLGVGAIGLHVARRLGPGSHLTLRHEHRPANV